MILTRIRKGLPTHSGVNCEAVLKNLLGGSKGDVTELFKLCSYSNLPRGGFLKAPNPKPQGLLKSNILLLHHLEQTLFQYAQLTNFVNFAFQHHFTSLYITLPLIYYLEIASNEWSTANKSDELLWSLSLCWSLFFFSWDFILTVSLGIVLWIIFVPLRISALKAVKPPGKLVSGWGVGCANHENDLALAEKTQLNLQHHLFLVSMFSHCSFASIHLLIPSFILSFIFCSFNQSSTWNSSRISHFLHYSNMTWFTILLKTGYAN